MLLSEIILSVLTQINRDTDDQSVSEFRESIRHNINEAYAHLAKSYKPRHGEPVKPINRIIDVDELRYRHMPDTGELDLDANNNLQEHPFIDEVIRISNVYTIDGLVPIGFEGDITKGHFRIALNAPVIVQFVYMPKPLVDDIDEPILPKSTHSALISYAIYKEYLKGAPNKQSRGMAFLNEFNRINTELMNYYGEYRTYRNIPKVGGV